MVTNLQKEENCAWSSDVYRPIIIKILIYIFRDNYICYIQRQNSNMIIDFPELLPDIKSSFNWTRFAFSQPPDAINFWMGDERAITSSMSFFCHCIIIFWLNSSMNSPITVINRT